MASVDIDPVETAEWLEALESVVAHDGPERAGELLDRVVDRARRTGVQAPVAAPTPYVNTIPVERQASYPGDLELEHRIRSMIRWNAMAMVLQANKESSELGGHIASYQSAATLYEVGFHHFWHAPGLDHGGDLVYMQGHSSPGFYARAFLEGRLTEEQLDNLIFVVNCNLQRLDGPVRGNGKIIQELETVFAGAGWNVIKVIWGGRWDSLLAADHTGILRRRMEECVDGEYQTFKSRDG